MYPSVTQNDYKHCVHRLIPAGETEFAKDASFGYKSSNLREVKYILHYFYNYCMLEARKEFNLLFFVISVG